MPKTEQKTNMGKAHNKSTLNSTHPTENSYKRSPWKETKTHTIVDIFKELKEYKEQIRELREENEKLRKDLEEKNDTLE